MLSRPATRADLQAVVDLFCAYDVAFRGGPDTDETDLTDDWELDGFSFERQTLVLEDDGRVVGYATVVEEYADAVTTRDRGDLLPQLLDWVEAHDGPLEHYVPDPDSARNAVMAARGWLPARRFWRMRVEHEGPPPRPAWPAGVVVRDYRRPDDDVAVHRLVTTAFAEIGGQHDRTLEAWRGFLVASERFDPQLYLVAEVDGRVVGAALSQDTAGEYGFVRQLAVDPAHRGRGLALALLHECFARHVARGLPATALGVDAGNPTGALALYEKAGMRVHEQFTRWDRPAAG